MTVYNAQIVFVLAIQRILTPTHCSQSKNEDIVNEDNSNLELKIIQNQSPVQVKLI